MGTAAISFTGKKVIVFSVPSRDVTNQTLSGWKFSNYSPPESLVSDIPAGDGKIDQLFLQCKIVHFMLWTGGRDLQGLSLSGTVILFSN